MESQTWTKIIYLSLFTQWAIVLSTTTGIAVFLVAYYLIPAYQEKRLQCRDLQVSVLYLEQRMSEYRQRGAYYLLSQRLSLQNAKPIKPFIAFILSYGSAIKDWQESENQQQVKLLLEWEAFLRFWTALVQLERRIAPDQLQLSAQDDAVFIQLTYEKKENSTLLTHHLDD